MVVNIQSLFSIMKTLTYVHVLKVLTRIFVFFVSFYNKSHKKDLVFIKIQFPYEAPNPQPTYKYKELVALTCASAYPTIIPTQDGKGT